MEPKLVANFASGLNQYYKPWLQPEDAFPTLTNSYLYRGNIRKRQGFQSIHPTQVNPLAPGPVMGLCTRINKLGEKFLVAFNRTSAWQYGAVLEIFTDISNGTVWTGSDSDFFWSDSSFNGFWVTNNFDPIRYYNSDNGNWYDLDPIVHGTTTLEKALLIVSHRQRLIVFNTVEDGIPYVNRARWSAPNNPYATGTPVAPYTLNVNAWRDDIPGNGGFIDCPTSEKIVSVGFNRDNLVVFFENSTYTLNYTGNTFLPFEWEEVNSQFGSESTFSAVEFDQGILATSRRGIVIANTNQVERIDDKIPDVAVGFNTAGLKRIHGARHYFQDLALWSYSSDAQDPAQPESILVYNYREQAWAIWEMAFSCFGNAASTAGLTWAEATFAWDSPLAQSLTWSSSSGFDGSPFVVGGTPGGSVFLLTEGGQDNGLNYDFEVLTKRFMFYGDRGQAARLHYVDMYFTGTTGGQITVDHMVDENTQPVSTQTVSTSSSNDTVMVRVYLDAVGRTHQLRFYLSGDQLNDSIQGSSPVEIQGMIFWVSPAGRIV